MFLQCKNSLSIEFSEMLFFCFVFFLILNEIISNEPDQILVSMSCKAKFYVLANPT